MLGIYLINSDYVKFLHSVDSRVPISWNDKANRPFLGVLLEVGQNKYYAPLTSPKPKFNSMSNRLGFVKIDNGRYGAIEIINMFPVIDSKHVQQIDFAQSKTDSNETVKWKRLVKKQALWCNQHQTAITRNAERLYILKAQKKLNPDIDALCCDFLKLERAAERYCAENLSLKTFYGIKIYNHAFVMPEDNTINIKETFTVQAAEKPKDYMEDWSEGTVSCEFYDTQQELDNRIEEIQKLNRQQTQDKENKPVLKTEAQQPAKEQHKKTLHR